MVERSDRSLTTELAAGLGGFTSPSIPGDGGDGDGSFLLRRLATPLGLWLGLRLRRGEPPLAERGVDLPESL